MFGRLRTADKILSAFDSSVRIEICKCVRQRNKRADCTNCSAVCPVSAITVSSEGVFIEQDKCTACGRCVNACKVGALSVKGFSEKTYFDALISKSAGSDPVKIICSECSDIDNSGAIRVPCLSYVTAETMLFCAASGAEEIRLYHKKCTECRRINGASAAEKEAEKARSIYRITVDIEEAAAKTSISSPISRRDFFRHLNRKTKSSATGIMNSFSHQILYGKKKSSFAVDLPIRKRALNFALYRILKDDAEFNEHLVREWVGIRYINSEKCRLCGICYKLCPTGALSEISEDNGEFLKKAGIAFNKSMCSDCGNCLKVCSEKALAVRVPDSVEEFKFYLKNNVELIHR
ncbi:hypothetical protein ADMFC3_16000 [Geovibrio sp. ADMFC3]